jgi:hypothetical protein
MRRLIALLIVTALVLAGAGCGGSKSNSNPAATSTQAPATSLAKTKFVLHAGLAFGAFHRYIYKPLKSGAFSGGILHHKLATLKAALAAAFAYHEVQLALADARSSKLLSKLLAPLLALQTRLGALRSGLRGGHADAGAIESANASAGQVSSAGQPVSDLPTPALGG